MKLKRLIKNYIYLLVINGEHRSSTEHRFEDNNPPAVVLEALTIWKMTSKKKLKRRLRTADQAAWRYYEEF